MKRWNCCGCGKEIEVEDNYEFEYCCDGRFCGCMGLPINPVSCDNCESKINEAGDEFRLQISE